MTTSMPLPQGSDTNSPAMKRAALRAHEIKQLKDDMGDAVASRNLAIREAYAGGDTIAELSRATGLTRAMLYRIVNANSEHLHNT